MDRQALENIVFDRLAETALPAVSIAVVHGGELVYQQGFGRRDLDSGAPATPRTRYSIGSVTKSFTALAILQLAEQNRLTLDDPVRDHLPIDLRPCGGTLRIEHLLTHTLGTPALAYSEAMMRHANGTGGRPLPLADSGDMITFMAEAEQWAEAEPGQRWMYANEGYALLGAIVEAITGESYEQYVRGHILQPLGMDETLFDRDELTSASDVATPYVVTEDGDAWPGEYVYRPTRSEGGLVSNVTDLAKYLAYFLAGDDARVVSRSMRNAMLKPRIGKPSYANDSIFGGEDSDEPASYYGYGLEITPDFLGHRLISHAGNVHVATAYLGFVPDQQLGVAVLANGGGYPLSRLGQLYLGAWLGADVETLPFRRIEATERFAGLYQTYKGTMRARVVRRGDFLELTILDTAQPRRIPLVPERIESDRARYYTLIAGQRVPAQFRISDGGDVELIYERYKLRRLGTASH